MKFGIIRLIVVVVAGLLTLLLIFQKPFAQSILNRPAPPADYRLSYGDQPLQFGYLRLPKSAGKHPLAIVIHGGCWLAAYDLEHIGHLSAALTKEGIATWSLEYRRIGDAGGGYPGTFEDIGRGVDFARTLARDYSLDLSRIIIIGHSAGGQLALWAAGRKQLPKTSLFYAPDPLPISGVVSLAGITDLKRAESVCNNSVSRLLAGAEKNEALYRQISPVEMLPLNVEQWLIQGESDRIVPVSFADDYQAAAQERGEKVRVTRLKNTGHFELIDPDSTAWPAVRDAASALLRR